MYPSQLNASVSAFQRRFVVDVRRCEELEKTFSKLGSGPRSRLSSRKETGQTWSEGEVPRLPRWKAETGSAGKTDQSCCWGL